MNTRDENNCWHFTKEELDKLPPLPPHRIAEVPENQIFADFCMVLWPENSELLDFICNKKEPF